MKAAIYCRLSEEDRNKLHEYDDSNSIQNQKSMLIQYALGQGWSIFDIYSDDDYAVEFGYPFFLENEISLDFDNNQIGLKGREMYHSYIDEYLSWKSKIFLGGAETFLYVLTWLVVIASLIVLSWYCYNEYKMKVRSISLRDINREIND